MNFKSDWIDSIPPGIEARGRNGFFQLARIHVSISAVRGRVAFYSSRIGDAPPMLLTSENPENLRAILRQVLEKLDDTIDINDTKKPAAGPLTPGRPPCRGSLEEKCDLAATEKLRQ